MAGRTVAAKGRRALYTALIDTKGVLEARLWHGDEELRASEQRGEPRPDWEGHWLRLLARYEAVCDALHELETAGDRSIGASAA